MQEALRDETHNDTHHVLLSLTNISELGCWMLLDIYVNEISREFAGISGSTQ